MTKRTKRLLALMAAKPKLRRVSGLPPLTYKAKKAGTLTDYRIYGQTSRNLFDGIQPVTNNTTDTRDFLRVWFRAAKEDNLNESIALSDGVDLNSITTITRTFTMPSGYNRLYIKHNGAARDITLIDIILEIGKTYTISFKVDGHNPSIVDGIEITNIMLNTGSTALPYEPYGESVGDRTGNLFDGELIANINISSNTGLPQQYTGRVGITTPLKITGGTYCFTFNSSRESTYAMYSVLQNNTLIRRVTGVASGDEIDASGGNELYIAFYKGDNGLIPTEISNIMLNSGSEPLPYEPYGYKVPVTVEGKNLLQNTATSQTINGVTFTVNSDGSVTCNGTASASIQLNLITNMYMSSGTYILSGCPTGGSTSTYELSIFGVKDYYSGGIRHYGNPVTFSFPLAVQSANVAFIIRAGYTCDNLTFYPMIRRADITDDTYEPYQPPVTTNLYLPEQIRKVGDEAEYIDYGQQKQHRVRKNLWGATIENGAISSSGVITVGDTDRLKSTGVVVSENTTYTLSTNLQIRFVCAYNGLDFVAKLVDYTTSGIATFYIPNGVDNIGVCLRNAANTAVSPEDVEYLQLEYSSTATPYEPYITNTELNVTLPALPTLTGTNVLSVGTEVQPSLVEVTGRIRPVPTGGGD